MDLRKTPKASTLHLMGRVAILADLMPPLFDIRPRRMMHAYTVTSVRAASELTSGTYSESRNGRSANAMRLARHLYEQELVLHYVAERPAVRLSQVFAKDAETRLRLVEKNASLTLTGSALAHFQALRRRGRREAVKGCHLGRAGFPAWL